MRTGIARDSGQISVEWVGVLSAIAAIVVALSASGITESVAKGVNRAVCYVATSHDEREKCGDQTKGPRRDWLGHRNSWRDADPDHDGLANLDERRLGTDPKHRDSDGDGVRDGTEARRETLPRQREIERRERERQRRTDQGPGR